MRNTAADWAMLLALTVMWGSAFLLTKVAVTGLAPPLVVAGRLVLGCALLLVAWAAVSRRRPRGRRLWAFYVLIAFFGNALPFTLISWGQQFIPSGLAGILMAVMPLATLGLAHFTIPGERLTVQRVAGFLLGFTGVAVLMGPDALPAAGEVGAGLLPMLAVLAGAFSYAVSAILARLRPASDALSSAAATTLLATAMVMPLALGAGGGVPEGPPPGSALAAVALLGLFSTAVAAVVYFRLITRAGPAFVSQLNYLIPLWAVAVGVAFLGESPEASHLYALALILAGIFVSHGRRRTP
jgi:drug/metabolite transporter (DMT)-like permease